MLWNNTQESWKDFLKRCLQSSAADLKLNQEMQADEVVKVHNTHGGSSKTGLHFNPASVTEGNRLKANNMTLQRYMDREELFELLPYVLGGMSDEAKLAFASQYLHPAGLTVHLASEESHEGLCLESVCDLQISTGDAFKALAEAAKNPTPQNLDLAEREAVRATEKFKRTRAFINAARSKFKTGMNKVLRKQPAIQQ